jgi:hypothetical protein
MIRKTITPDKQTVSIDVPENYVGKQIEVLVYATDELEEQKADLKKNTPKLRGALKLSDDQYKDFQQFVNVVRNEWDKAI